MKGISAFILAIALVGLGGAFVFVQSAASPPATAVLFDARGAGVGGFSYQADESIAIASGGGGASLVRHRAVTGTAVVPGQVDMRVTEGDRNYEFLSVKGVSFVRSDALGGGGWLSARGYPALETALTGQSDPVVVKDATLADRVVDGSIVPQILAGARRPHREGLAVRDLAVTFDPDTVLGRDGTAVDTMSGEVKVDGRNRPVTIVIHLQSAPATIDATYHITWAGGTVITVPASSAELPA